MNLRQISLIAVGIVLAASLLIPQTRELNVLCARLLLHTSGKTYVQGQPSGCVVYVIPNVQFTESYRKKLRIHSADSPDDFILANSTGDFMNLAQPPAIAWKGHPFLNMAAIRLTWFASQKQDASNTGSSNSTNATGMSLEKSAHAVVKLAQAADADNGALWLAEAALDFDNANNDAALTNLQIASKKARWDASRKTSFDHMIRLFQKAGLSKLDAAIEANSQEPDIFALSICGIIRRELDHSLVLAIKKKDDRNFSDLLQLLVQLRDANWRGGIQNNFRRFIPSDDLVNVMAKRMGHTLPSDKDLSSSGLKHREEVRDQVFDDYLKSYANAKTLEHFLMQRDSSQKETDVMRQKQAIQSHLVAVSELWSDVFSVLALFTLSFLIVAVLSELPFAKLRYDKCAPGTLPRQRTFWLLSSVMVVLGIVTVANFFFAIGTTNEVGLRLSQSPSRFASFAEPLGISFALCCVWFSMLLVGWKSDRRRTTFWWVLLVLGGIYCASIFAGAYFRSQLVKEIAPNFLSSV